MLTSSGQFCPLRQNGDIWRVTSQNGRLFSKNFHFTQILFENVTQEKIDNPSYSRRSPPSSFSNLTVGPNSNPNINPFGYVQLGNLKKNQRKQIYCQSFYSATKKKADRFGSHPFGDIYSIEALYLILIILRLLRQYVFPHWFYLSEFSSFSELPFLHTNKFTFNKVKRPKLQK